MLQCFKIPNVISYPILYGVSYKYDIFFKSLSPVAEFNALQHNAWENHTTSF